ncbi:SDR family oxidoreductase [Nocardioides sp. cx-173]|uniref:SDR family oxidoreductase n=1 Tax=Nocardioides sp. cx-173 TaxID=2898796 RepID=UPI001E4812DA|nr:SDR family oxidoreductase [Nocardioides sp. cx-173]MCD4526604.1 SDR family oxidoreductase [Nocardioides sp. cx-173]UGB40699.1 SDR family oxidoreductase [Nocardioides sp. cx-173]
MSSLNGTQALVAGGAVRNLPAIRALVDAGARVVIQAQTPEETKTAHQVAADLGSQVQVTTRPVATFADAEELVAAIVEEHGSVDALVTPVAPDDAPSLVDLDEESWTDYKSAYVTRAVALTRAASAVMAGQATGGRVVVLNSASTFVAPGAAQSAANAALLSLSSAASAGLRDTSVRVNGLLLGVPGAYQGGVPAPTGEVDMFGPTVAWLAGEESEGVNGKFVYVGGSDVGFYSMPMVMENANVQVRFDGEADSATVGQFLNNLVDIGKVQRQA